MAKHAVKSEKLIAYLINIHLLEVNRSWEQLATDLEISQIQLARLALCNRPNADQRFQDLKRVSEYVEVDINRLGRFITQIENSVTFRNQTQFLMAARDRDKVDEDDA
jgi:hypothetical protein